MRDWQQRLPVCCFLLFITGRGAAAFSCPAFRSTPRRPSLHPASSSNVLPEPSDSNFGRRDYWDEVYKEQDSFSWYTGWSDVEPFIRELIPVDESLHILIPGIGNDATIVDMYDAGYRNLTAFDYAPAGVDCARRLLGEARLRGNTAIKPGVTLLVADSRDLPFESGTFSGVFEKGTLDAIYLSGGHDKELASKHLSMAVSELRRVVVKGGIIVSITAACVDAVQRAFDEQHTKWEQLRDGNLYITEDGYSSTNVDGTLLAWKRR